MAIPLQAIEKEEAFQRLLYRSVTLQKAVPGALLRIESPGFTWAGAAGLRDRVSGAPLRPGDAFHAASITKMFTATLCLLLAEEGVLDLDRGIGAYLPNTLLGGLHVVRGLDRGCFITLRQLLGHTSGLADCFSDGKPLEDGRSPFMAELMEDPERLWQPPEVIDWTREHLTAHFAPAGGWHYCDTGFVLAGLVIEAVTGMPLHQAYRAKIFRPLAMNETYLLFREAPPSFTAAVVSQPYVGALHYGGMRSISADWAGGGLVTTAADLARFLRAFAEDRVFRDRRSRQHMMAWRATGEHGVSYGLGMRHFNLEDLGAPGFGELWGHTGFLKGFMLYWPAADAVICGTENQSDAAGVFSLLRPASSLVPAVLRLLAPG
ncbi:serine hydrolase [Pelagibius sp.]|uniref:serine hydrolase domain-containing protein n=1 Tax=Pelagibius sp. TaxID=1931238 RepID=UPI002626207C|nr:serine hydrolase domain-containing protein [Pelagibius sp.]